MDHESSANDVANDDHRRLRARGSECIGLAQAAGETHLVALRRIATGERLFVVEGETTDHPSRHSLQIGRQLHLEADGGNRTAEGRDRHLWRFLNHSCDPNALVRGREVLARRTIVPGEVVTFDYNTTEWDMATPFDCRCGSAGCIGKIHGFKHLTAAQRGRLAPYVADHLRPFLPDGATAADVVLPP